MMNKKTDNAGSGQRILLAVSFGTSFEDTREKTIGAIETRIGERIPHYTVQRCFTSRIIRKKLLERDGLRIDSPERRFWPHGRGKSGNWLYSPSI